MSAASWRMWPRRVLLLIGAAWSKTLRSVGGNVGLIAAVALPAVALAAVGGVQIAYVLQTRAQTQSIADSAALMAAQQLGLGTAASAESRAVAWANGQLATILPAQTAYKVSTQVLDQGTEIMVTIHTDTPSFFGADLPVGGFPTTVQSTAQSVNQAPLCVLITRNDWHHAVWLDSGSNLGAASCVVYSDSGIWSDGTLNAQVTEAAYSATHGAISPAALTGAPQVTDPFASMDINFPMGSCGGIAMAPLKITANMNLPGGTVECGDVEVASGVTLTLGPGEVYFHNDLTLDANSVLTGADVCVFFGNQTTLSFDNSASVTLSGRQSGTYAGFVIITSPDETWPFTVPTDPISKVTGTIYSRNAPLVFSGAATSSQASDWTVIVANALRLHGSPDVVVNANYATSSVPVPTGVGPRAGPSKLVN